MYIGVVTEGHSKSTIYSEAHYHNLFGALVIFPFLDEINSKAVTGHNP